jgi:hypothetical protein
MNLVFTMAGTYKRFRLFSDKIPKYLYPLGNENVLTKVIQAIIKDFNFTKIYLIANRDDQLFDPIIQSTLKNLSITNKSLIYINDTLTQLETSLACSNFLSKKEKESPICFANIDTIVKNRKNFFKRLILCKKKEALLDVFPGQNSNYSYVRAKDTKNVSEVIDYKIISSLACSGLYGFGSFREMSERSDFILKNNINANFSDLYNDYIKNFNKVYYVQNINRKDTLVLGTPEEYIANIHKF